MSQRLNVFHPDFCLLRGEVPEILPAAVISHLDDLLALVLPFSVTGRRPFSGYLEWRPFPFDRLPTEIQARIFKQVFVRSTLIHCLSRLDPSDAPADFPQEDQEGRSQLLTRFHFGTSPCQVTLARKPNSVLSPLLVCKRWLFIGVHAFYGANTFAFSSLGEWHRFCNGIGAARVERLANIEIMWHGSLMQPHDSKISRRTLGLSWLMKTHRLRTLVVHVSEGSEGGRRKYELLKKRSDDDQSRESEVPDEELSAAKLLIRRTFLQPNHRAFRSMRTVQGIDYLYQLRGMDWVRFKERDGPEHRQTIRDWSFLKDLNTVVTLPKPPELFLKGELENLTPLSGLEKWTPAEEDMCMIKLFYDDNVNLGSVGGSETSATIDGSLNDDFSSSSSSDSDEDSDDPRIHHIRKGPVRPIRPFVDMAELGDVASEITRLFLSDRSGSARDPLERMDVDPAIEEHIPESVGLESSGSGVAHPESGRVFIDLTNVPDDEDEGDVESSLFVRSNLKSESVKREETSDGGSGHRVNEVSQEDVKSDPSGSFVAFIPEGGETPPISEDERYLRSFRKTHSNIHSHSSSSKRKGGDTSQNSSNQERPKKRRRIKRKRTSKFLS